MFKDKKKLLILRKCVLPSTAFSIHSRSPKISATPYRAGQAGAGRPQESASITSTAQEQDRATTTCPPETVRSNLGAPGVRSGASTENTRSRW